MQNKSKQQESEAKQEAPTSFICHAPGATAVFLAGTFNDWDPLAIPMEQDAEGKWHAAIPLHPGRYEFKFIVDGQWYCEADQAGGGQLSSQQDYVSNPFGSSNYVIDVASGGEQGAKTLHG